MHHPKSIFVHKDTVLNFGPIWDFDWQTFTSAKTGFVIQYSVWNDALVKRQEYRDMVKERWASYKPNFESVVETIDSLNRYLKKSNDLNYKMWPIYIDECFAGDEDMSLDDAFAQMKSVYKNRIKELDSLFRRL